MISVWSVKLEIKHGWYTQYILNKYGGRDPEYIYKDQDYDSVQYRTDVHHDENAVRKHFEGMGRKVRDITLTAKFQPGVNLAQDYDPKDVGSGPYWSQVKPSLSHWIAKVKGCDIHQWWEPEATEEVVRSKNMSLYGECKRVDKF